MRAFLLVSCVLSLLGITTQASAGAKRVRSVFHASVQYEADGETFDLGRVKGKFIYSPETGECEVKVGAEFSFLGPHRYPCRYLSNDRFVVSQDAIDAIFERAEVRRLGFQLSGYSNDFDATWSNGMIQRADGTWLSQDQVTTLLYYTIDLRQPFHLEMRNNEKTQFIHLKLQ